MFLPGPPVSYSTYNRLFTTWPQYNGKSDENQNSEAICKYSIYQVQQGMSRVVLNLSSEIWIIWSHNTIFMDLCYEMYHNIYTLNDGSIGF